MTITEERQFLTAPSGPTGSLGAIIETRGLKRTFRSRRGSVEAVSGIDLTVYTGEIFGFLSASRRPGCAI